LQLRSNRFDALVEKLRELGSLLVGFRKMSHGCCAFCAGQREFWCSSFSS
jgi:hypothetical protein